MESSFDPTDYMSQGLKRLVDDIDASVRNEVFGLEHVICGFSDLAGFNQDHVEYCGIDVVTLVETLPFEGVIWLLLTGHLPTDDQLADAAAILRESGVVEQSAIDALTGLPLRTQPLEMLPLAVSMLSYFDPTQIDRTAAATRSRVWRMLAQLPVLLSAALDSIMPTEDVDGALIRPSLAASILATARGPQRSGAEEKIITPSEEDAMNAVLICQCLTELRPACFTARFFGSTVGDVVPSLRSATSLYVAQMRNDPYEWICRHLRSFENPDDAQQWLLKRQEQTLPFGFSRDPADPRSMILSGVSRQLLGCPDRIRTAACAERLERLMSESSWHPTMDWHTSVVLTLLDIPPERTSLVIALSRMVGWAAQAIDQNRSGVSLLPQLQYST